MPTDTVSSWRDLDEAIAERSWTGRDHAHSTLVFRGLARSDYSNVSSLARLRGDYARLEPHLVRNFRKYAHRESPGPSMWDWLALGQHHGLPTRLLDWTFSPLVALHFATASWASEEAVLLAVDCSGAHRMLPPALRDTIDREGALVFTTELLSSCASDLAELDAHTEDEPYLVFFEPPSLDERIVNQAAVLSAISDPAHQMEQWLEEHPDLWHAWRIPPGVKEEVRERLDQSNITERVLLPGLDGLAAWLRRYYTPEPVDDSARGGSSMAAVGAAAQEEGSMSGPSSTP